MVAPRFLLKENTDSIELTDADNTLSLNHKFNDGDREWLDTLVTFLNKEDIILRDVIIKYSESVNELNDFRAKIIYNIQEEIRDCEKLITVDKKDQYTQGRLIELHNLMKILL